MTARFPTFSTDRLVLRELRRSDVDAIFSLYSDPEVMRWMGFDTIHTRAQAIQLIDQFNAWRHAETGVRWAICLKHEKRLIGTCGLFRWNHSWRNCLICYDLLPEFQHSGYMSEALQPVLNYAFDPLNIHRIQAEMTSKNLASANLVRRLGFQFEGIHRQQGRWGDTFHDLQVWSLLSTDLVPASAKEDQPGLALALV